MNATPKHFPSRRLFEVHWNSLSDLELVALLIGAGSPERRALRDAQRLLEAVGSPHKLKEVTYPELRRAGLGRKTALAVLAAMHLFRRIQRTALFPGQPFRSSIEIFRHFQPLVEGLKKECFWNVLLDGKNRILRLIRVSEGSLTSSLVHPREVFRPAIQEAAAGVLFVHNHPSGDPAPSPEDIQITKRLVETGRIVGIRALDHVIIGAHRYFSFADQGLL
ncbi:DNA repair protein RadC [Acidobacteria bacterium AH-259-O06]|nr:DNA repair protein RadC [Acidobacteria bacterium AH-259-O06]